MTGRRQQVKRSSGLELPRQFLREVLLRRDEVPDFQQYPYCIPALLHLNRLPIHPSVTFFVGENGTGKSTLLEAIAVNAGMNPEGGGRNFNFSTRESHSELHRYLRVVRGIKRPRDTFFLRAESLFNVATEIEQIARETGRAIFGSYGGRSLHEQSHGESFMALLLKRLGGGGLYLMDEPEAALSPVRQLAFLVALQELVRRGSQLVIASHSPIILAYPDAWIYQFGDHEPRRVAYTDTEHYQITRDFLVNTEQFLEELFDDSDDGMRPA